MMILLIVAGLNDIYVTTWGHLSNLVLPIPGDKASPTVNHSHHVGLFLALQSNTITPLEDPLTKTAMYMKLYENAIYDTNGF